MSKRGDNVRGYERWMKMAAAVGAAAFGMPLEPTKKPGEGAATTKDPAEALWEHKEIFTDDDEAVGNDSEEIEDLLAAEIRAPPVIKQDDEEQEGELLGKAAGLESDAEDDDDEQEDEASPVIAPKKKEAVKDKPDVSKSPSKPEDTKPGKGGKGTPASSKSSKGKRKATNEESKLGSNASPKKPKAEPVVGKEEIPTPASKSGIVQKGSSVATKGAPSPSVASTSPVTEEEIRKVLLLKARVSTQELVGEFKQRFRNTDKEGKKAFTDMLKRICKMYESCSSGIAYVVLK